MRLIVFLALLAAAIALCVVGAKVWFVFALALVVWIAFFFWLYPKIRTYQVAMGLDDRLDAAEATGWAWLGLRLAGFKVLILGFLTSMLPFLGDAAQWLNGQKLDFFFDPSNPKTQQTVAFAIGVVIFLVPFATSAVHSFSLTNAAVTPPKA